MSERRKAVVLLDYENVFLSAAKEGKVFDLSKIIEIIKDDLNVIIKGAFCFVPYSFISEGFINEFDEAGFYTIACPATKDETTKEKNRVDIRMIEFAKMMYEASYIDDIVIVSNDSDFSRLANYFKHRGKRVIVIGTKNISAALIRVADITIHI